MKVFALLLVFAGAAVAAPIGRPVTAEHQWILGGVGSFEQVKVETRGGTGFGELKSHLWLAEAAYGFNRDIEFTMRVGTSNDRYTTSARAVEFGSKFNWGVGLRGTMYESWQDWRINGDLQYLTRPGRSYQNAVIDIKEWQAAASVEYDLREFHPYFGLNYSRIVVKTNNPSLVPELVGARRVGAHFGAGFSRSENWSFLVEARFLNATAFSSGATFHF